MECDFAITFFIWFVDNKSTMKIFDRRIQRRLGTSREDLLLKDVPEHLLTL
jgi:hypothetical protein